MAETGVGAIVLAGGKSSRMGCDKALLEFGGMTILERTISALLKLTPDVLVVSDSTDRYKLACGRLITDLYPGIGPVGGLLTGLNAVGEGYHYVVACDMPFLNPNVLALLMRAAESPLDAVVPERNGMPEPLCGVYSQAARHKLMKYLEDGGSSARGALEVLNTRRVGEGVLRRLDPDGRCFDSANTIEDYERLKALL